MLNAYIELNIVRITEKKYDGSFPFILSEEETKKHTATE